MLPRHLNGKCKLRDLPVPMSSGALFRVSSPVTAAVTCRSRSVFFSSSFPAYCSMRGGDVQNGNAVAIGDPANLRHKIENIRQNGSFSTLQVIADFDMTLTKYLVNGRRGQSSHSLIKQGNSEYDVKRQELFDQYYPLEVSPDIPLDEKSKLMEEWWEKTHLLLVEGGLTRQAIVESVSNAVIEFRDGVDKLFALLEENGVPVLIFSAGLSDIIEEVMRQKLLRNYSNVRVISNRMEFDSNGSLIRFKGKTIHVLNKNEHALGISYESSNNEAKMTGIEEINVSDLKKRKNVLLLGDHLGDLGMSDGLVYNNQIAIGFLNEHVDGWLDEYRKQFDVVLMNDITLDYVINLVQQLAT